jgi:hypothetical protein
VGVFRISIWRSIRERGIVVLVVIGLTGGSFRRTELVGQKRGFGLPRLVQLSRPARDQWPVLADDRANAYRGTVGAAQQRFNLAVSRIMRLTDPALGRAHELTEPIRPGRHRVPSINHGLVGDPLLPVVMVSGGLSVARNPRPVEYLCYLRIRIAVGVILHAGPCRNTLPVLR